MSLLALGTMADLVTITLAVTGISSTQKSIALAPYVWSGAAAVARASVVRAIGIDAEPDVPLPAGVLAAVATQDERRTVEGLLLSGPRVPWDRLLFCAKEAALKACSAQRTAVPDLRDVVVVLGRDGTFAAAVGPSATDDVRAQAAGAPLVGRWAHRGGLLLAAVTVTA